MTALHTFGKKERIVSKKLIETLFEKGESDACTAFPLKAVYKQIERNEGEAAAQILISVPKKRFKHAVDRNRVKRQVRESYRLNKPIVTDKIAAERQLLVAFIWLSDKHYPTDEVMRRTTSLLKKIAERL